MKYLSSFIQEIGEGVQNHAAFQGRKVRFQVLLILLLTFVFCVMFACLFTLYLHP